MECFNYEIVVKNNNAFLIEVPIHLLVKTTSLVPLSLSL